MVAKCISYGIDVYMVVKYNLRTLILIILVSKLLTDKLACLGTPTIFFIENF